jgi:NADH-quinone oxidoreductase subunit N
MDYSQFLLLKEELSLILVIVILFVADLFMSPDAHKNDGKPVLNTMLPVALLTIHTLITIVPGPVADAFGGMYHNQPIQIHPQYRYTDCIPDGARMDAPSGHCHQTR